MFLLWKKYQTHPQSAAAFASFSASLPCSIAVLHAPSFEDRHMSESSEPSSDSAVRILFCNDSFLKSTGYSRNDLEKLFHNHFLGMLLPSDRASLAKQIQTFYRQNGTVIPTKTPSPSETAECRCRLVRKDGTTQWFSLQFRAGQWYDGKKQDRCNALYCVVSNITQTKRNEDMLVRVKQELYLKDACFRAVSAQSQDVIFEYDVLTKRLTCAEKFMRRFGYTTEPVNFPDYAISSGMVYSEDGEDFLNLYKNLLKGAPQMEGVQRIRADDGGYMPCHVTLTAIQDEKGDYLKILGFVRELSSLHPLEAAAPEAEKGPSEINSVPRDSLTGFFARRPARRTINDYLHPSEDAEHAIHRAPPDTVMCSPFPPDGVLLLLDIYNFKNINDSWGRGFGNQALRELASRIRPICSDQDILCRDDDAFLLFRKDCSPAMAKECAQQLCDLLASQPVGEEGCDRMAGHIGIACYPKDGDSFDALYQAAEQALQIALKEGPNHFAFASPSNEDINAAALTDNAATETTEP